jgi:hypothetical protein
MKPRYRRVSKSETLMRYLLFNDIAVIACSRPGEGGLKSALIAKARRAAKQLDQPRMGRAHIIGGRIKGHWASRRSNSGWAAMNSSIAAWKEIAFPLRSFRKAMNSSTADCSAGESRETTWAKSSFISCPNDLSISPRLIPGNTPEKRRRGTRRSQEAGKRNSNFETR